MPGNLTPPDAKKQIVTILKELLVCFPEEITLVDYNSREWVFNEKEDESKFKKNMEKEVATKVYPVRDKKQKTIKWIVITKMRTSKELREWKENEQFYTLVQEAKTYMFPHPFKSDEWEISTIGFIKEIHVAHYTREHLHQNIKNIIEKQEKVHPTFQLIPQRITNNNKTATTRAYTVQCVKSDARQLIHLLTHGEFRKNPIFIPFKYKTSQPETFTRCIRKQNEVYHKTWVIKLAGISPSSMEYISEDINNLTGVFHVVPTRRLEETGEWKVLVDYTKCAFIHRQLTKQWPTIVAKIPQEVLDTSPSRFPFPTISSQKVRGYQDESSETDSYGSILTIGTEHSGGFDGNADNDSMNDPPLQYQYPTYASAVTKSTTSQDSPQMSSPTASLNTDWQSEKRELEELIRQQAVQIERIQADLQAKVSRSHDLEEQLAQAIELAHSRDARHEEMLQKFELMMTTYTDLQPGANRHISPPPPLIAYDVNAKQAQITPPTRAMTTQSPPPKKSNQGGTPQKTMYPVFRQYDNKPSRFKRPQALLTQPMDPDDSMNNPKPEGTSGNTSE